MIWSIIPEDVIFSSAEPEAPWRQSQYLGRQVLLRPAEEGMGEIMAVLSTDPLDFIDSRLQPGQRVPLA